MLKNTLGLNKVYNSDCIKIMKDLPNESVDLIIADPPYNVGKDYGNNSDKQSDEEYIKFTESWITEAVRILKKEGTFYTFGGKEFIAHIYIILGKLNMIFNSWIVWHYTQGQGRTKGYSSRHDDILMFTKSKNYTFNLDDIRIPQKYFRTRNNMRGANPGNVWGLSHVHYSEKDRSKHPTQKPHALYERMILSSSNEGEIVLDPFAGSGSSLVVAKKTNRNYIGIEIEEKYCSMIEEELNKEYKYFNSSFEELIRVPKNLNDKDLTEYLHNHRKWFLEKYHSNKIPDFEENILSEYGKEKFIAYKYGYKNIEEIGIASLFRKGGTYLSPKEIEGLKDFELVSFLVVKE